MKRPDGNLFYAGMLAVAIAGAWLGTRYLGRESDEPFDESRLEREARKLGRHEGVQRADDCAPGQEVDAAAAQLTGARTGEDEAQPGVALDEMVDHVEEFGDPLHLVDHDRRPLAVSEDELGEPFGAGAHLAEDLRLKEVDDQRVALGVPDPARLAGAARPEEEEALFRSTEESSLIFQIAFHFGIVNTEIT